MGSIFSGLGSLFGTLFSPIGTVFHYVFFEPVFNVLILIYHGVGSFALAIVLLTLLIRGALFPLTRRQLASTRKMQELQPRLKQIQAQHRGDPQAAMAAQQALYKEHGVSMYGGCLPLVIQMPFLYSLFYAFEALLSTKADALQTVNSYIYPFLPKLTALPVTHFLWTDLKTPDPLFILPVIAGVLTFIQMRMAMPVKRPGAPTDTTTQTAQSMQWVMPIFTLFLGTRFPSGLALYWTVSTGFSAVQQYLLSGWGSLFVGVPGMERFVPPPKDLAAPATPPATIRGAAGGRAGAEPTQPERPAGFLASMRELIQQTRTQAQAQAVAAQEQRTGRERVVEAGEGSGAIEEGAAEQPRKAQGAQAPSREKRPRPPKSGATLVRPSAPVESTAAENAPIESAADLEASTSTDLPEDRIVRDAQKQMDGIIADAGARLNGDTPARKMAAAGTTSGANRPVNAPRSSNQRKGQQAKRKGQKGGR